MPIRQLAREIYTCQSKVHKLEDQWENGSPMEREDLKEELRLVRGELKLLKRMLEGKKEQSSLSQKMRKFL